MRRFACAPPRVPQLRELPRTRGAQCACQGGKAAGTHAQARGSRIEVSFFCKLGGRFFVSMANRHLSRSIALQSLFEWDFMSETATITDSYGGVPPSLEAKNVEFAPRFGGGP